MQKGGGDASQANPTCETWKEPVVHILFQCILYDFQKLRFWAN